MRITQHTKISELIKFNEQSIDAIASIAKPLRKIKIPLLRKFLTPRVSIAEAAKIANVPIADFKRVLEPLGFEWVEEDAVSKDQITSGHKQPAWIKQALTVTTLDVRPTLQAGLDPLKEIMTAFRTLPEEGVLNVINTFIPYPLIRRLEDKGAGYYVETFAEDLHHTYFYKKASASITPSESENENVSFTDEEEFTTRLAIHNSRDIIELDVRDLPMPQPMETILGELPKLSAGKLMYIRHRKVPLYLLEELTQYHFPIYLCNIAENDVRILIYPEEK